VAEHGAISEIGGTPVLTEAKEPRGAAPAEPRPGGGVTVAIPTKNRPERLRETMESVLGGSRIPDEIVVSDQSPDGATRSVVERMRQAAGSCRITYIRSSRPGSSANRNDALRAASGDFVAFVDDDIRVDTHWLENLLREWEEGWTRGPVLISGRILSGAAEGSIPDHGSRLSAVRTVFRELPRSQDLLYGGAFAAPRELFDHLGPEAFDERLGVGARFRGGEDEDLGYRALRAGFPVVYEPTIVVTHYPETDGWRRSSFIRSFGGGAFFAKHVLRGDRTLLRNFGRVLLIQLGKAFRSYLRLREREGTMRLLASAGLIAGFLGWVLASERSPATGIPVGGSGDSMGSRSPT
jgi:glycosyltransferase involved in cell wall biosynthesis